MEPFGPIQVIILNDVHYRQLFVFCQWNIDILKINFLYIIEILFRSIYNKSSINKLGGIFMRGKVSLNMAVSIFVAIIPAAIIAFLLSISLESVVYQAQMGMVDLSEGSIGSQAGEDIPVAQSIADMVKMDEFTVEVSVLNSTLPLDGTYYYKVFMPSGEIVAALVNQDAVQEFEDEYKVRLPIGKWVEWKHSAKEKKEYESYYQGSLTDFSHYIDMQGDFGNVPSTNRASSQIFSIALLFFFALFLWIIRREGVRRGWFPPEIFVKKYYETANSTKPKDDTERWCLATYAMWAYTMEDEKLIAGMPKIPKNQKMMKELLSRDWSINNADDGRRMVQELTAPGGYSGADHASYAWDWCRAIQLLGCFFLCDYIDRQEMRTWSCQIGRKIQLEFSSWEDLCENYLAGYTSWSSRVGNPRSQVERRNRIYKQLKENPVGPYTMPFKFMLLEQLWEERED